MQWVIMGLFILCSMDEFQVPCTAGWAYAGGTLTSPKQAGSKETATILHRFHFTSTLKRMTVVVKVCPGLITCYVRHSCC